MSSLFTGVKNFVSYTFNSLDQTSAANDIIVVKHRDGSLKCSPFNVRFGKAKVMRPGDKIVNIEVNDAPTSAVMKMGDDGVAFWLIPTSNAAKNQGLLTSPLQSPRTPTGESPTGKQPTEMSLDQSSSPIGSPGLKPATISAIPDDDEGKNRKVVEETDGQVVQVVTRTEDEVPMEEVQQYNELLASLQTEGGNPLRNAQAQQQSGPSAPIAVAGGGAASGSDTSKTATPESSLAPTVGFSPNGPQSQGGTMATSPPMDGFVMTAEDASHHSAAGGRLRLSKFASSVDDVTALAGSTGASLNSERGYAAGGELPLDGSEYTATEDSVDYTDDITSSSLASSRTSSDDFSDTEDEESRRLEDEARKEMEKKKREQHYKRSFEPQQQDLEKLNLLPGKNTIRFRTNSRLRGEVSITAHIYLWTSETKICVSDIDGTVTKSDVWGHLLPRVGKDWTHPGICELYSNISKNGYEFLYVTARSVSQIESTKNFIFSIRQNGQALPEGPTMTAPDKLWDALTQEVGHRSHEFKIACLKSVASAFPKKCQPFFAGFGNRIGDVIAYTALQIPKHKILIIDASSAVHVASVQQTYSSLAELVEFTFPAVEAIGGGRNKRIGPTSTTLIAEGGREGSPEASDLPINPIASSPNLAGSASGEAIDRNLSSGAVDKLATTTSGLDEGEHVDAQFTSYNYWNDLGSYFPPPSAAESKKQEVPKKPAGGSDSTPSPTNSAGTGSRTASPQLAPKSPPVPEGGLALHRDPNSPGLPPSSDSLPVSPEGDSSRVLDSPSKEGESAARKSGGGGWFSWGRKSSTNATSNPPPQDPGSSPSGAAQ